MGVARRRAVPPRRRRARAVGDVRPLQRSRPRAAAARRSVPTPPRRRPASRRSRARRAAAPPWADRAAPGPQRARRPPRRPHPVRVRRAAGRGPVVRLALLGVPGDRDRTADRRDEPLALGGARRDAGVARRRRRAPGGCGARRRSPPARTRGARAGGRRRRRPRRPRCAGAALLAARPGGPDLPDGAVPRARAAVGVPRRLRRAGVPGPAVAAVVRRVRRPLAVGLPRVVRRSRRVVLHGGGGDPAPGRGADALRHPPRGGDCAGDAGGPAAPAARRRRDRPGGHRHRRRHPRGADDRLGRDGPGPRRPGRADHRLEEPARGPCLPDADRPPPDVRPRSLAHACRAGAARPARCGLPGHPVPAARPLRGRRLRLGVRAGRPVGPPDRPGGGDPRPARAGARAARVPVRHLERVTDPSRLRG